jgi:hypothetical protein
MVPMVSSTIRPAYEVVVIVRFARVRPHVGPRYQRETVDDRADEETFTASYGDRVGP